MISGVSMKLEQRGIRLEAREVMPGIGEIRVSNRWSRLIGMHVYLYLAGQALVDTGFSHAAGPIGLALEGKEISAILCTHNHEDHTGNCGTLARRHNCHVYLSNPELKWGEGVDRLPFYRRLWWGKAAPFEALPMPEKLTVGDHSFKTIKTPGHSDTHVALFDEQTGALFTGDLYVSSGASAVMRHENPYATIKSLRQAADLEPAVMLGSHSQVRKAPAEALRTKADRMEQAAREVLRLHDSGLPRREIEKRLFKGGAMRNLFTAALTADEFSRANFVKACIRHREDGRG